MATKRNRQARRERRALANTPMIGGRFNGRPLKEVPRSYLEWIMANRSFDPATRWLVARYLGSLLRTEAAGTPPDSC
jgi:uncharacterized protein (DUF3820 family)